jgi:hypothetical protein
MKNKRNTRILFISFGFGLVLTGLFMYSCEKESIAPIATHVNQEKTTRPIEGYCGQVTQNSILLEPINQEVGQVLSYNDQHHFYLEITSWNDYLIEDAYLFIGTDRNQIPLDKFNNPDLSAFTYAIEGKSLTNIRKFRIPLNELPGYSILSCAVEMRKPKKSNAATADNYAWIDGHIFGSSIRGRYFGYDKQICRTTQGQSLPE